MAKKETSFRNATIYVFYLLVVWGFYRVLFKLPVEVEEFVIKPIVWLVPLVYFLKKENKSISSLGITTHNLFKSIYLALALGVIFAIEGVIVNLVKYQGIEFRAEIQESTFWMALVISFTTAISEEVVFRGYLFDRLWKFLGKDKEWTANLIISFLWSLIHVPIAYFWWKLSFETTILHLFLIYLFGVGAAFVYARTKNIVSPILLHVLWTWPIVLFR